MMVSFLRRMAESVSIALAAVLLLAWVADPAFAQRSSRDRDSFSRSSSRDRSSRVSRDDDYDDDDEDFEDESDSRSRRSSRSARSSRSSSSRSSRSSSRRGGSSRSRGSNYVPPAVVFGTQYERAGVRPRGNLLSIEAFEALPCKPEAVSVGATTYHRCGDAWYNQINHEGWICYSEIFPPAGATVASLPPGHHEVRAGERTLYATERAFFEAVSAAGGTTRYVVVEPAVGLALESLPSTAKEGIAVQSGRHTYYRYLGVFYREEPSPQGTRYVVSENPFLAMPPLVGAAAAARQASASVEPGIGASSTVTSR